MSSKARQKIDGQTLQLFDAEVDRPEHDQVVTMLYEDSSALAELIQGLLGCKNLTRLEESSVIAVRSWDDAFEGKVVERLSYSDASRLTGIPATWDSLNPIRIKGKELEVLMNYSSNYGRSERLIGFVDIGVTYQVVTGMEISREQGRYRWEPQTSSGTCLIEVKSVWPTMGNLIRQLNLYSHSVPVIPATNERHHLVVGLDETMAKTCEEHRWRTAVFEKATKEFRLLPKRSQDKPLTSTF